MEQPISDRKGHSQWKESSGFLADLEVGIVASGPKNGAKEMPSSGLLNVCVCARACVCVCGAIKI